MYLPSSNKERTATRKMSEERQASKVTGAWDFLQLLYGLFVLPVPMNNSPPFSSDLIISVVFEPSLFVKELKKKAKTSVSV